MPPGKAQSLCTLAQIWPQSDARSTQTPEPVSGAGAAAVPGELEPITGAELGLLEDPRVPDIGNEIGETCDDMLGDAVPFVGTAGVAVSPGDGEGVGGTLGDAPVVEAGVAVSPGDGEGVDGMLGDAPVVKAGVAVSPGNVTGDVLGAAVTPGGNMDAGEGDSVTPGETPGGMPGGMPGGDIASGDNSGEVSGSGVPVGVGGRGMVEPGTSDAWLLRVDGDWPGDLTTMLGEAVAEEAGEETGEEGDSEAGEEGAPSTGAPGVAGDTEVIGKMGGDCTGVLIGLGTVGDATGLVGPDVELGVPAVLGVVVNVVGVAVATGDGDG